jgi:hypothetical protein
MCIKYAVRLSIKYAFDQILISITGHSHIFKKFNQLIEKCVEFSKFFSLHKNIGGVRLPIFDPFDRTIAYDHTIAHDITTRPYKYVKARK